MALHIILSVVAINNVRTFAETPPPAKAGHVPFLVRSSLDMPDVLNSPRHLH